MRKNALRFTIKALCLLATLVALSGCGLFLLGHALKKDNDDWSYKTSTTISLGEIDWGNVDSHCKPSDEIPDEEIIQEDEIIVKKHYQRVIRYGCDPDGTQSETVVKSDKWELVEKPQLTYFVYPEKLDEGNLPEQEPWYRDVRGVTFNRSTCGSDDYLDQLVGALVSGELSQQWESFAEPIDGRMGPRLKFEIDLDNRKATQMKVKKGLNVITYDFMGPCLDPEADGCFEEKTTFLERGVLVLNVIFDLKRKGDIKEIKYIDDCLPSQ